MNIQLRNLAHVVRDMPDESLDESFRSGICLAAASIAAVDIDEDSMGIDNALRLGLRGLPGGSSLSRLLKRKRAF